MIALEVCSDYVGYSAEMATGDMALQVVNGVRCRFLDSVMCTKARYTREM